MRVDESITVAIPTIGRIDMLTRCIESISQNTVLPKEVLIADQSDDGKVKAVCENFPGIEIRVVQCKGKGVSKNRNLALRESRTDHILMTDDDCLVAESWVETCSQALKKIDGGMITGKVLPSDSSDSSSVPSTISSDIPVDYTGTKTHGCLYSGNMGVNRLAALEIGGFDERRGLQVGEDLDFNYRWLCAGKPLHYIPESVVFHLDWRTPSEMGRVYRRYARHAGVFYGKHLAKNDLHILNYIKSDLLSACYAWKQKLTNKTPGQFDERLYIPFFMPIGLIEGVLEEWYLRIRDRLHF